ncbi:MAG: helix-turn-helix transcriptional regulator [Clostridia bacterium]|nr:helix-turn-helix transcriptional regulator [Clostridia bacterium]
MNSHLKLKNNLKEYRQKAGLTQTQLAEKIGSTKNTISSIETRQFCPTAYLAALLCIALNCKFEDLFYLDLD